MMKKRTLTAQPILFKHVATGQRFIFGDEKFTKKSDAGKFFPARVFSSKLAKDIDFPESDVKVFIIKYPF